MEQPISIREYARRRGISDTAVRKAIKAGKIEKGLTDIGGVPAILESIANQEWAQYAPVTREPKPASKTPLPNNPTPAPRPAQPVAPPQPQAPASGEAPKPQAGTIAAARLVKEQLHAKKLELEIKVMMGKLVDKEKVYSMLFNAGQEIRSTFQSIPDRFIDEIISAPSRNEAHALLYNAITDALERTAKRLDNLDVSK